MSMRSMLLTSVAAAALTVSLAAFASHAEHTVHGECQSVYDGDVCTWGTMAGDRIVDFGATVPLATVENAPAEAPMVFPPQFVGVVALPAEIAAATGFNHVGVNWEPHGHPPALFLTPHFDFHFYTIAPEQVAQIDCVDVRKPTNVPATYTLPDEEIPGLGTLVGLCVPNMGMHAMLRTEIDDTVPFGASMILGYYQQKFIFLEPMISQAKLREQRSFAMEVPAVANPGAHVKWPTRFEATYDEAAHAYRFRFSGFPEE